MILGLDGETTTGRISGWGSVRKVDSTLRIRFFGQVIADGEGEARDLNMASFRTVGTNNTENLNGCGTNGWFAVNKGRLIYPRAQNCSGASHPTIGDYPNRAEPTVMNSFRYTLDKPRPEGTYYNFAELYAPDREDIPRGLPVRGRDVIAGVWRFGLSSASGADIEPEPIAFTGMILTFRYDWREMREGQTVVVYRHDGTENGTWTRVRRHRERNLDAREPADRDILHGKHGHDGQVRPVFRNLERGLVRRCRPELQRHDCPLPLISAIRGHNTSKILRPKAGDFWYTVGAFAVRVRYGG